VTKFPNGEQRFPNELPVGPNIQLNAKRLASVGAQRAQWSLLEDNEVDRTVNQLLSTTVKYRNEVDLGPHLLHFPCSGDDEKRSSRRYSRMIGFLVTHAPRLDGCSARLPSFSKRLRAILRMPRYNRAPGRELLVLGLLSRLADCIILVVGMTTSRYRCRPTRRNAGSGLLPDKDRVVGASTPCSPRPCDIWRHEQPGPNGDLDARNRKGVERVLIQ